MPLSSTNLQPYPTKTMIRTLHAILGGLLLALVIILASSFVFTDPHVYLLLEELNGLKEHDQVSFRGIPVGHVQDVTLFEEVLDDQTLFVVTLVFKQDQFKHLYREMKFDVEPVSLFAREKQLVITDDDIIKLNRLQRNEYIYSNSDDLAFMDRALKIFGEIERDTQPFRENLAYQVKTGVRNMISQIRPHAADTTAP